MAQLKINRGTTYNIGLTYQKNGVAATLVGATVRFTMKATEFDNNPTDATAVVVKNVTTGTINGEATITLLPADTALVEPGTYYYDLKVTEAGGAIFKLDEGKIKLDGSATNRIA